MMIEQMCFISLLVNVALPLGVDIGEGVIVRYNEKEKEIAGIAIIGIQGHSGENTTKYISKIGFLGDQSVIWTE